MKRLGLCRETAIRFASDRGGNFAIIVGLAIIPLLLAAGGVLDYANAEMIRRQVQASLDAAALEAAIAYRGGSRDSTDLTRKGEQMFIANFGDPGSHGVILSNFTVAADMATGAATASADVSVKNSFLSIVSLDTFNMTLSSTVSGGGRDLNLDIAMCIDATGSMGNTIAAVKVNALNFDKKLLAELEKRNRRVGNIRVRPIYFRDFSVERGGGIIDSGHFFALPDERGPYNSFVNVQVARGGGDEPESGLECLYQAMKSRWAKSDTSSSVYPIVAVWSDANHQPPGDPKSRTGGGEGYPEHMPATYSALKAVWSNPSVIDQDNKIFAYFGPGKNWTNLYGWDGFYNGGGLTNGADDMMRGLADAIAVKLPPIHVSR
ncbi:hypothetical protein CSC94_12520 [Zhengella mangrovi]|uniref:Putative Flp pilus-assembly TadG-like N-terminal domain-containing protein n=1 Tax=Zhengella mangrovi TaxID=1982044 RepID=A0A2G1QN11_9HYPH|nr:pilus assembly protein TadG-related protein [Zhengella mangrovi]PHP66915.1 hypothetical protein CSC94_12520 [Zhengella mangrovi]